MCRISELLAVTTSDIVGVDRILVHGKKKSGSYTIFLPTLSQQLWAYRPETSFFNLFPYSYNKLYRWCKKIGLYISVDGHINLSVLHAGRYLFGQEAIKRNNIDAVGDCLRHRNKNNTINYIQKRKVDYGKN
jgi:integrase